MRSLACLFRTRGGCRGQKPRGQLLLWGLWLCWVTVLPTSSIWSKPACPGASLSLMTAWGGEGGRELSHGLRGLLEGQRGTRPLRSSDFGSIRGQVLQRGKGYLVQNFLEAAAVGRDVIMVGSCLSPPSLPRPWCGTGHVFCDHPLL